MFRPALRVLQSSVLAVTRAKYNSLRILFIQFATVLLFEDYFSSNLPVMISIRH